MMHCSSEKPDVPNIHRLATRLPLRHMCQYQATLVFHSLAVKMRRQRSSHSSFLLSMRSGRTRLAGAVSWVVEVA